MSYRVVFSPAAAEQLVALYRFIAAEASPAIADRYTEAIIHYCESIVLSPLRGTKRDDVREGLRVTHYKKRAIIAFAVEADVVSIIGVFYGGQDYESLLSEESDEGPAH